MCHINLQKSTVTDNGLFTLRRNKKLMTIIRSPFKSLPIIHNNKNGLFRASSEGPTLSKVVNSPPVVC